MAPTYEVEDLVWAKMKGFSPWPGKVVEPNSNVKKPSKKNCHFVFFFGSGDYAWIENANLKPFFAFRERLVKANKTAPFKDAIVAIDQYIEEYNIQPNDHHSSADSGPESADSSLMQDASGSPPPPTKLKIKLAAKKKIKTPGTESSSDGSVGKKRKSESIGGISSTEKIRIKKMKAGARIKDAMLASPSLNAKARVSALLDRPVHIHRPDTPPLDVGNVSQALKDKKIEPSKLKFGFLGLGVMGSGIVKNLLNSGHSVRVWNRSSEKCGDFIAVGAEEAMTPSDVIAACDITFSCVSDPQVAKNMVFGNCGVLQEMSTDKAYVEMTGIDAETSQDLADAMMSKGGRYLEAQIQGSREQAENGTLVILASGDRSLFDECQSCFQAMGKNSFFLGEVGNATKMNLVLQVIAGVTLAGLAEGMAL
ncbi:putative oxidoreductase GLYR1 homolog, partial [Hyalella azteca]|uniref:Cytokine-like nuclear factor N-PAC n=1 Tax=Hyalella azteca TaxID=294128 RepID=A0A8B7PR07_HYAAZ